MYKSNNNVFLRVLTGTMFSGKSDALIAQLRRYLIAKKNILLFKPALDDRYGEEEVVTHDGISMRAISIKDLSEIKQYVNSSIDVIGIDEVQFFNIDSTVKVIEELLFNEYPVIVAGLDMDYKGRPFGAVPYLMAMADDVQKFKAVCNVCGDDSMFEYRKDKDDNNLIKLGSDDEYDSLCRSCRKERMLNDSLDSEITDISI